MSKNEINYPPGTALKENKIELDTEEGRLPKEGHRYKTYSFSYLMQFYIP